MRLIKLLPLILAFCPFSLLFSQNPALITRYLWNADYDTWQPHVRDIYVQSAPQQEVLVSQIWDTERRQWRDWTRTTTHLNAQEQATYSLTEKISGGTFVPVIQKQFVFDASGKLLEQVDHRWDANMLAWKNLYRETHSYGAFPILDIRKTWRSDASGEGWLEDDFFEVFDKHDGSFQTSIRRDPITEMVKDQLTTRIVSQEKEEVFCTYQGGACVPLSRKVTVKNEQGSFARVFEFSTEKQDFEEVGFENTYLNDKGQRRNVLTPETNTRFRYDDAGRLLEKVRSRPLHTQAYACVGQGNPQQEIADVNISREVYEYADRTAAADEIGDFDMTLFPNPMTEVVGVQLSEWISGPCILRLMDLRGRVIRQVTFGDSHGLTWDRRGLVAGTYLLQLVSSKGTKTARLMVTE